MYGEGSALSLAPATVVNLENGAATGVEINSVKLKEMLQRHYSYPADHRKQLWSYILQLPRNKDEFEYLRSKSQIPQAVSMCRDKGCRKRVGSLFSALIHWYAPVINCEWMPHFLQKLDAEFGRDQLFCFEVTVTFLVTFFNEWITELPGPPASILSRIDTILTNYDPDLRDALGSGLVSWSVYRSSFAEVLYDRSWLEVMDVILSSAPQFLEFMVCGWIVLNGSQLRQGAAAFHATRRPVNCDELVKSALRVWKKTLPQLKIDSAPVFLSPGEYPLIESKSSAAMLRSLQSDYDKLMELQRQLQEEKKKADDAERVKQRKQQTFDSIEEIRGAQERQERIDTARAAAELDNEMTRLRLEGRRLRQNEETLFIEQWRQEWDNEVDFSAMMMPHSSKQSVEVIDEMDMRMQSLMNMRQSDVLARDARRVTVLRAKHVRREMEAQVHENELMNELRGIASNHALLVNMSPIKKST